MEGMLNKKNILVVDDSALMRRVLSDIIESDIRFAVKDVARNGEEALELITKNYRIYDAVLLDINMPYMDGLEVLRHLKERRISKNVIIVSSLVKEGAKETIIALENGAFDFVKKPENYAEVKSEKFKKCIIDVLCAACDVKEYDISKTDNTVRKMKHSNLTAPAGGCKKLVAVACSTGGPKSLKEVIPRLSPNLDAPVVIVQHMPAGFTKSLADRLDDLSMIKVKEGKDGDILKNGCVYLAPGGKHLKIREELGKGFVIQLSDEPPREGVKPCANIMFESIAGLSFDSVICVVLTGMGADGTDGIKMLDSKNRIHVIAQDEKTSVVYGMPRAVAQAGLADEILPLDNIAEAIIKNTGVLNNGC